MNITPSANEFLMTNSSTPNEEMLIKFAQLHVKVALEEAFKVSQIEVWEKELILNSYPLEKIK